MSLIAELKRRNVFRVGVAYVVAAWLILQLTEVLSELMELESDVGKIVIILLVVGFIPALIFAWAFELTPDGVKREKDVDRSQSITPKTGRKLDFIIIGMLALGMSYFFWESRIAEKRSELLPAETTEQASESGSEELTPALAKEDKYDKSIAVLPFANLSDDASNEYFSHGISEELLNVLTRVTSLRVASRTSSFSFIGTNTAIPEIAAQLNVNHILEGSVRKAGNQVRITAQLIDVESDSHLWSDTYDRELDDIFGIQKEIAINIVAELNRYLISGAVIARSIKPPKADMAAYEIYLQGRYLLALRGEQNLEEAASLFEQAVEIDNSFAAGFAALGKTYALLPAYRLGFDSRLFTEKSEAAIDKALQLDPDQTEALIARGFNATLFHWEWDEARAAFEHALRINPNDADVHNFYGDYFTTIGDFANAEKFERRAMELDMLADVHARDLAFLMMSMGRYDEALTYAQRALELHVSADGYDLLTWSQLYLKNFDAAREAILQMEALPGADPAWNASLWTAYYHAQQDWDRARPYYEKLKEAVFSDKASAALTADFALGIEGVEAALELMELAYVRRDIWLTRLPRNPEERSTDPRWLAFWEKPGLKELVELRRSYRAEQGVN
jgi:TolB-like protein/Tfp pilus assembly protein PilF